MKRKILYFVWGILLYLGGSPALCADDALLMHVDDLLPGMKGIGRTVFSGTNIEEFEVEILGVLKNQTPHGDAIMAKVSGGPLPLEKSGVLAGMSGSPVYIDGKLIGAVAFIPTIFPKEPMIAGITPIHEMLRDANRVRPEAAPSPTASMSLWNGTHLSSQAFSFVPIQTPLMVSGVDQRVMAVMEEQLAPFHFRPVQGGSASQALLEEADTELKPGSAVGVQLVRGDMDIDGIGTVTYREGDKIIAFGHPMFFAGDVSLPMTAAYVNFTVSNLIFSFKQASTTKTVGTITQDRRTGISGMIGQMPDMLPLDVTIYNDENRSEALQYAFEIADLPQLTSLFMKIASFSALLATEKSMGDITIQTRLTIVMKDAPPLRLEDQFSGSQSSIPAIFSAFAPLDMLMNNRFEPVSLERVSLEMTVKNMLQVAEVMGVRVRNNVVSPGENVEATIILRPYNQELITVTETVAIPEDIQSGRIHLVVCDANITTAFDMARAGAKFQVRNLSQLTQLLRERVGRNTIVLSLFQPKPGAVVQGQELPSPPMSMMTLMTSTGRYVGKNSLTRGRILMRTSVPTQYVISGCTALELIVDHTATGRNVFVEEHDELRQGEKTP